MSYAYQQTQVKTETKLAKLVCLVRTDTDHIYPCAKKDIFRLNLLSIKYFIFLHLDTLVPPQLLLSNHCFGLVYSTQCELQNTQNYVYVNYLKR